MKFAPLIEKIATAANEAQLRSTFLENAGELVGAKAWGFDLLDCRFQVIESDLYGLPDTFRDRYQAMEPSADIMSQRMIQQLWSRYSCLESVSNSFLNGVESGLSGGNRHA